MSNLKDYFAMMNHFNSIQNQFAHINLSNYSKELAMINKYKPYFLEAQKIAYQYRSVSQTIYPEVYQSIVKAMGTILSMKSFLKKNKQLLQTISSYNVIIQNMHIPMTEVLQNFQYNQPTFQQLANYYSSIRSEFIDENKENKEKISEELTEADQQEIANAVQDIMSSAPRNWICKTKEKYYCLEKDHPIIAKALIGLLLFIIQYFLTKAFDLTGEAITKALVRENPTSSSQVITVVEQKQQVFILDGQPYYWEIKFTDEQTGKIYKGWISKRSVKQLQEDISRD